MDIMNSFLYKVISIKNLEDRFKVMDELLDKKVISINMLEDYYANYVGIDTIAFAKRYYDYINIKRIENAIIESKNSICIYC